MKTLDLSNLKAIFFDMGNTLIDFHQGPEDSSKDQKGLDAMASYFEKRHNMQISSEEISKQFIEKWHAVFPKRKILQKEFPIDDFMNPFLDQFKIKLSPQEKVDLMILFDSGYQKHLVIEPELTETLEKVKSKFKIGIISNSASYPEVNINHFNYLNLDSLIDSYTFSYSCKNGKPESEIFLKAMDSLKVKPNESMMVGDSLALDIFPAKSIGMKTAWLNSKHKKNETKINPDFEVKTLKDLCKILNIN